MYHTPRSAPHVHEHLEALLEEEAFHRHLNADQRVALSIAISLKRLADSLERPKRSRGASLPSDDDLSHRSGAITGR